MENNNSEPATSVGGESEAIVKEKVDYEIREIIRAYPEDYARILDSLEAWTAQFD